MTLHKVTLFARWNRFLQEVGRRNKPAPSLSSPQINHHRWHEGGTCLTTATHDQRPLYEETLRRYHGTTQFVLCDRAYAPNLLPALFSVHCLSPHPGTDLGDFWRIFQTVKEEYLQSSPPAEPPPLFPASPNDTSDAADAARFRFLLTGDYATLIIGDSHWGLGQISHSRTLIDNMMRGKLDSVPAPWDKLGEPS